MATTLDEATLAVLRDLSFPERPRRLGDMVYFHLGNGNQGVYLPFDQADPVKILFQEKIPVADREALARVVWSLATSQFYSPGNHFACAWITGDIGEIRQTKIDGKELEVLVVPQGAQRAQANAANFRLNNMDHKLLDPQKMLEVMAVTMFRSGFPTPYFRGFGFANEGNNMTLEQPRFYTTFAAATWDFFGLPSYKLPSQPKVVMASPVATSGHPLSQAKIASTYQTRIDDRQRVAITPRAQENNVKDTAYFLPNGLLADASCQNLAFAVENTEGGVTFVFPDASEGNYFFQGKTQATMYKMIKELNLPDITAVRVQTPEEFAIAAGYKQSTKKGGRDLMYRAIAERAQGMIVLGTFKGIEVCSGFLPEEGYSNDLISFPWSKTVADAVQTVQQTLWKSVYGINGGTTLTQDPWYCTMFDTQQLAAGIVQHLDLHGKTLEDMA